MVYAKLIFFFLFIISVYWFTSLAPWVPTRKNDLKRIDDIIKFKANEKFLEIWCWTAKVTIYIAKNNPNSMIYWIELSPLLYIISRVKVYFSGLKNIQIMYWNALKIDFKNYDVLYIFWLPDTIKNKLFSKLKAEMKANSRFISYCFKMENNYFKEEKNTLEKRNNIYCYTIDSK